MIGAPRSRRLAAGLAATILVAACGGSSPATTAPSESTPVSTATASATATAAATPSASPTATGLQLLGDLPTSSLDQATSGRLQAALDAMVKRGLPDAIAAVITTHGTWAGAAGVDGPGGRLAAPTDEFAIASVSKTLTATLIMHLVEQGKIDLDKPLATYLGANASRANGATVRQALGMRAGLDDTADETLLRVYADCSHAWTAAETVVMFPAPVSSPGAHYLYSNPTYKLLSLAAEHVTGQPLATAVKAILPDATTVDRLLMQGPGRLTPKPWALPIEGFDGELLLAHYGQGGTLPCLGDSTFSSGASGMAGDAPTLARWGWLLFSGKVIQPSTLETLINGDPGGDGLGLDPLADFRPEPAYGHAGSKPGYASLLAVFPSRGIVLVLLINSESENVAADARALLAGL